MFLKDRPTTTHEETPPPREYDRWLAEEAGEDPPEDIPTDPSIRAEENAEYYRSVS